METNQPHLTVSLAGHARQEDVSGAETAREVSVHRPADDSGDVNKMVGITTTRQSA